MELYSAVDFPHRPGADPFWQESWVLVFRDQESGLVGFLRTGSYFNQGTTQTHWGMALPDGLRFRRHLLDRKLEPADRTDKMASSGTMRFTIPNLEYCRFEGFDKDAEADLRIYDWFPSQDWQVVDGPHHGMRMSSNDEHGHPESAGRVEGRVRIGDRVIEIRDGIGYRDHGYGPRPLPMFRSARWHAGTVGPRLTYSLLTMQAEDGSFSKAGFIMLDGKRETVKDLHTVNCTLSDGLSSIGGWTVAELEDGRILRIDAEAVDGVVTSTNLDNGGPDSSPAGIEVLSIPRWEGLEGVCDFNMIDNAHRGSKEVSHLLLANSTNGISRREFDPTWLRR